MATPTTQTPSPDGTTTADPSQTMGPNTCGFIDFTVTTMRFPMIVRPWTCASEEAKCTSSGSYLGCSTPLPTACRGSSLEDRVVALDCKPDELCWYRPNTVCYTWLSPRGATTCTLFECRSTTGIGILLSTSFTSTVPTAIPSTNPTSANPTPKSSTTSGADTPNDKASPGAVAAGIAGAVAFLGFLIGLVVVLWWYRRRRIRQSKMPISRPVAVDGVLTPRAAPAGAQSEGRMGAYVVKMTDKMPRRPLRPARSGDFTGGVWF